MALRDYDFCETKGLKAFGPYSQSLGGCVYFTNSIPDVIYTKQMDFTFDWIYEEPSRLLLPRELM